MRDDSLSDIGSCSHCFSLRKLNLLIPRILQDKSRSVYWKVAVQHLRSSFLDVDRRGGPCKLILRQRRKLDE
jgi:hypothetical protein